MPDDCFFKQILLAWIRFKLTLKLQVIILFWWLDPDYLFYIS